MDDPAAPGPRREPSATPMRPQDLRAGDADRDLVLERLRTARAEGRLEAEEFDERVATTLAARTYGDLAEVTADLPGGPPEPRPLGVPAPRAPTRSPGAPAAQSPAPQPPSARGPVASNTRAAMAGWAGVSVAMLGIWLALGVGTGEFTHPWWIWVAGPWGIVLLVSWLAAHVTGR